MVAGCAILVAGLDYGIAWPLVRQQLVAQHRMLLQDDLAYLHGQLEPAIAQGRVADAQRVVAEASVRPDTLNVVVVDAAGRIVAASRRSWLGASWRETPPGRRLPPSDMAPGIPVTQVGAAAGAAGDLVGRIGVGGGVLIVERSLLRAEAAERNRLRLQAVLLGSICAVFGIGLLMAVRRHVERRAEPLISAAAALVPGDDDPDCHDATSRRDPLETLGATYDRLLNRISQERLAMRRSADEMRDLYEHAPCGYHSLDAEGRIVKINQTELDWLGYARDEVIGRLHVSAILSDSSREIFDQRFDAFKRDGVLRDLVVELARKDGSTFPVMISATAVVDANGQFVKSRTTVYDLRDLRRADRALRASEERFRTIFDSVSDAIFIHDGRTGAIETVNRRACELYGYSREEFRDLDVGRLSLGEPPYADADALRLIEKTMREGPQCAPWLARDRNDRLFWVEVSLREAEILGERKLLVTAREIGERRRAEAMQSQLASVVEWSRDAIIGWDLSGHVITWNTGAERLYGYDTQTVLGMSSRVLLPQQDAERMFRLIQQVQLEEEVADFEAQRITRDRRVVDVSVSIAPVRDAQGRVTGVYSVERDISARRRAQRQLVRVNRALLTQGACGSVLLRAGSVDELLGEMCRVIVETGGYRMAWVGRAESDAGRSVRPVACSGNCSGYLDRIRVSWADDPWGQGPTGTAIRTGQAQVNLDFAGNPALSPWREQAMRYGFASSIALPVMAGGRHRYALMIYAAEHDAFDLAEQQLLQKLAGDLGYRLSVLLAGADSGEQSR